MSVGSKVFGVVCAVTMMVPPLRAPCTSFAGPFAAASIALVAWVMASPWLLPPPELLFFDGLPQPAMPMATTAVAATASLNRLAISPLLILGVSVTDGCGDRMRHGSNRRAG